MSPEQIRDIVEQSLNTRLLPGWYISALTLFLLAGLAALGILLRAYLKATADNLARKEALGQIIDEVRHTTRVAEEIKSGMSGSLWVQQRRWDFRLISTSDC